MNLRKELKILKGESKTSSLGYVINHESIELIHTRYDKRIFKKVISHDTPKEILNIKKTRDRRIRLSLEKKSNLINNGVSYYYDDKPYYFRDEREEAINDITTKIIEHWYPEKDTLFKKKLNDVLVHSVKLELRRKGSD